MDLSKFHPIRKEQERLRKPLSDQLEIFKGIGCAKGYMHDIILEPNRKPLELQSGEDKVQSKTLKMNQLQGFFAVASWSRKFPLRKPKMFFFQNIRKHEKLIGFKKFKLNYGIGLLPHGSWEGYVELARH